MDRESLLTRLRAGLRERNPLRNAEAVEGGSIIELCRALISTRGEASGVALAAVILDRFAVLSPEDTLEFFQALATEFDPDPQVISIAAARYAVDGSADALAELGRVVEPPRQELLRRLNQAPDGTAALVRMRSKLLEHLRGEPDLRRIDDDFKHLLRSWFNRGFLVLQPITWSTPADILEKIIDYEAVHEIEDWDELRRRLLPSDRRCFAFFHPAMPREPLVFVEVALTKGVPESITGLLDDERVSIPAEAADTAVFYSISNCQVGLRGVSFGHFLIKQVVADLTNDLAGLDTFVTLSPVPGFAAWLDQQAAEGDDEATELVELLDVAGWADDAGRRERHAELIVALAASYFLDATRPDGSPIDPVARFHLGNGALLDRINPQANLTPTGLERSAGMMVNYRYDLDRIEEHHEAYATQRTVQTSSTVRDQFAASAPPRKPT